MAHIILVNPALDQVETHQVSGELFLQVYDLLHPKKKDIIDGLSFGAAQHVPEVLAAIRASGPDHPAHVADVEPERHTESVREPITDAWANSTDEEPELEPEPVRAPEKAPSGDQAFMASLASLFSEEGAR